MADCVLKILGPLLGPLGEPLGNLIKEQVSYLCCYSCNVRELRDEVSKLAIDKMIVNEKIQLARGRWGDIRPRAEVEMWLSEVDKIEEKSNTICNNAENVQKSRLSNWCPFLHYSLSREALETTKASVELRNRRPTFEEVANPVNAADLEPIPVASERLESRDSFENAIMDALKKNDVYLIGIFGMAGVGKTTMVENIKKKAREKAANSGPMFERVVMAVVSQQLDLSKIQEEIAEGIGLKFEEKMLSNRAERLHASLKNAKSVLIILDDVWERLNIEKIGIPSQSTHPGCKLIITSRDRNALTLTEDAKIFRLDVLSEQESWVLFRKHAGTSIDSHDLNQVAKAVLKECKELPLAIVTVGCPLRDKEKPSWEEALLQLQQPIAGDVPEMLKDVFGPLSWSFDRLENEEYRYLFLLCCIFPEDYVISLEVLVRYGMGLGIFKGRKNLAEARNRVQWIVEDLIYRSLLIKTSDYWGNLCVKMHDVIRDMGIRIAPKWKHVFMISHGKEEWPNKEEWSFPNEDYTAISLSFSELDDVPERMDYLRLELLRICDNNEKYFWTKLKIPDNFLSGVKKLKVLEVSHIKSLPSSINLLENLQTLHLSSCKLGMISVIGKLINLEILCLKMCDFIEVLPKEIGELKRLRKLDITACGKLTRIAFGVVSRLVRLEELTIVSSFKEWKADEKDEEINSNANLVELDSLSRLTTLCIEIWNPNAIPEKIPHWVHKVKQYFVSVGAKDPEISNLLRFQKSILLGDEVATPLGEWFYDHMAGDAQCLDLGGPSCAHVVNRLFRSGYQNLTYFKLYKCNNVKYLSDAFVGGRENGAIFPVLKTLRIEDSCSLEEISNGPPSPGSFKALEKITLQNLSRLVHLWTFPSEKLYLSNLKSVKIRNCDSLLYLPVSIAESLLQLERLEVSNCPVMKEIFEREEREVEITINKMKFPKLYDLCLERLPNLRGFYEGVDGIEVPALHYLRIGDLLSIAREGDNDIQHQFLFDQQVAGNSLKLLVSLTPLGSFNFSGPLQSLTVEGLHNVKSLFSPSALGSLQNLRWLEVRNCWKLEEVIGKDENHDTSIPSVVGETKTMTLLFPQLECLTLRDLPKLLAFSHGTGSIELPSLEFIEIENCPVMETFVKPLSNVPVNQPLFNAVLCPKLEYLVLKNLNAAKIFSCNVPIGLTSIKYLNLTNCKELEEVIAQEDQEELTNIKETLFPQLRKLVLGGLPKIRWFCHMKNDIELPSLVGVTIDDCPILETFSRGSFRLPSFKRLYGVLDTKFATKFFFKKEESSREIHLENNCFTISPREFSFFSNNRQLSFDDFESSWVLSRDSSDSFAFAAELRDVEASEITGKFEIEKLLPGVAHEIVLVIREEDPREASFLFKVTLPGGRSTQNQGEISNKMPRGEWVDILVGEFTREPDQIGQLEFSLSLHMERYTIRLLIKSVKIRLKI